VGIDDNFFDLGGTSLGLAALRRKLRTELGRDVPLVELFRRPTVGELARYLRGEETVHPSPGRIRERASRKRASLDEKKRAARRRRADG
jgi:aryl carrier-like protein